MELEAAADAAHAPVVRQMLASLVGGELACCTRIFRAVFPPDAPALPKGGGLCEEMGLGLRCEVLSLVLSNRPRRLIFLRGDPDGP